MRWASGERKMFPWLRGCVKIKFMLRKLYYWASPTPLILCFLWRLSVPAIQSSAQYKGILHAPLLAISIVLSGVLFCLGIVLIFQDVKHSKSIAGTCVATLVAGSVLFWILGVSLYYSLMLKDRVLGWTGESVERFAATSELRLLFSTAPRRILGALWKDPMALRQFEPLPLKMNRPLITSLPDSAS